MTFRKYNSITNSYQNKTVDKIKELGFARSFDEWIVTEKIHGANFQIIVDGDTVRFASRNNILSDDNNFYGYHAIREQLTQSATELWEELIGYTPKDFLKLRIYGELYGGGYEHPDVKSLGRKRIQDGVQYQPDIGFYAIDLYVEEGDEKAYLYYDQQFSLLNSYFFTAQPLFKGTLDECLQYPNEYITTIPALLNLPAIEDNICEGNVIAPHLPRWFPHADPEQRSRVILKNKNDRFSELNKHGKNYEPIEVTEVGERLALIGLDYVNDNRLNNVISKIGEIDYADPSYIGKLIKPMIQDTMADFVDDNEEFKELEKRERGKITKDITTAVRNLIMEKF